MSVYSKEVTFDIFDDIETDLIARKIYGTGYKIMMCLHFNEYTPTDLFKELKLSRKTINNHLTTLVKSGLVTKSKWGHNVYYKLTDDCKQIMYDTVVDYMIEHYRQINGNLDKYNAYKLESTLYGILKAKFGKREALRLIVEGRQLEDWWTVDYMEKEIERLTVNIDE